MLNKKKIDVTNIILTICFFLVAIAVVYPFYSSILTSFMTEKESSEHAFPIIVKNPTLSAYKQIFTDSKIPSGYFNTFLMLLMDVPLAMIINTALAYALSRKRFPFSKFINNMIVFTMYFGGGLIPSYLLIKSLGLMGSRWSVVLPTLASTYNMILIKSYFYTLPDSLEESAKLDGANDLVIFGRIFVPLAKPILATVFLFICVGRWNEWYSSLLYLNDSRRWPLSLVLRGIIDEVAVSAENAELGSLENTNSQGVKMASIAVTMGPIMILYPFLQKYFMSGLTIGAVKG